MSQNRVLGAPLQQEVQSQSFTTDWIIDQYLIDAALGSPVTVTLDPNAATGDRVEFLDIAGNAQTQPITIAAGDGQTIVGFGATLVITVDFCGVVLTYNSVLQAWAVSCPGAGLGPLGAAVKQGGNAFGANMLIGTTDSFGVEIITDGIARAFFPGTGVGAGQLQMFSSGTTARPAYTFEADATSGMYQPAVGQVGFALAGSQAVFFANDGGGIQMETVAAGFLAIPGVVEAGFGGALQIMGEFIENTPASLVIANYTVDSGPTPDEIIPCSTAGGAFTVTLPPVPAIGRTLKIVDATGNAAVNFITVDGNGKNISGGATQNIISNYGVFVLTYMPSGQWVIMNTAA